jgi:hypothetical protein
MLMAACSQKVPLTPISQQTTSAIPSDSKETIRQILLDELKLDPQPGPEHLRTLGEEVAGDFDSFRAKQRENATPGMGMGRLFSAIELAVHGDASGADTLLDPHLYYSTNAEFEVTWALAALVLIDRVPDEIYVMNYRSDRLRDALAPYVLASRKREVRPGEEWIRHTWPPRISNR